MNNSEIILHLRNGTNELQNEEGDRGYKFSFKIQLFSSFFLIDKPYKCQSQNTETKFLNNIEENPIYESDASSENS